MLVLGISANFVLDFVHVALKGIVINAEVGTLKAGGFYGAIPPLLPLAYAPVTRCTCSVCYRKGAVRAILRASDRCAL